jgi:hypothetical protein
MNNSININGVPADIRSEYTRNRLPEKNVNFFLRWVRLSPLGTSAINWPIVPAPDDSWWVWSSRWNENWLGKPKYSEKTFPGATLSTINPIWADLGSNPDHRGGKPATNHLNYGTAHSQGLLLEGSVQGTSATRKGTPLQFWPYSEWLSARD